MCARTIWENENKRKYFCASCQYATYNKALFRRHNNTLSHWLNHVFAKTAPRDIKIVVASFLPYWKIKYCGKLTAHAYNYALPKGSRWKIKSMVPASPPVHNDVVVVHLIHNSQTQVYAELLLWLYVLSQTNAALERCASLPSPDHRLCEYFQLRIALGRPLLIF